MFFLFRLKSLKELVERLPALSRLMKMPALLGWPQLLLQKHSISISINPPPEYRSEAFDIFYVGQLVLTTSWETSPSSRY